jgi:hypothetical protein
MVAAVLAAGVASILLPPTAAASNVVPGLYSGSHSDGGAFNIQVTPDGTGISYISASNVLGDSCTFSFPSDTYVPPLPIANDQFLDDLSGAPGFQAAGTFLSGGDAIGHFQVTRDVPTACTSGDLTWTAHNDAAPIYPGEPTTKPNDQKTCRKKGAQSAKKHHKKKGCGKKHNKKHKKKQRGQG